jgi:hypothetical protein
MTTGAGAEGRDGGLNLQSAAGLWMTPRSVTGEYTRDRGQKGSERPTIEGQAAQWPTPASRDYKGENGPDHLMNGTGRLHLNQLPNAVAFLYSPPALPTWQPGPKLSQLRPIWRPLRACVIASHGRATWRRLVRGKRRLNPRFVEWLMGWPSGHALCASSETELSRWSQDMRGALSRLPTAYGTWIWKPPEAVPVAVQLNLFGD